MKSLIGQKKYKSKMIKRNLAILAFLLAFLKCEKVLDFYCCQNTNSHLFRFVIEVVNSDNFVEGKCLAYRYSFKEESGWSLVFKSASFQNGSAQYSHQEVNQTLIEKLDRECSMKNIEFCVDNFPETARRSNLAEQLEGMSLERRI